MAIGIKLPVEEFELPEEEEKKELPIEEFELPTEELEVSEPDLQRVSPLPTTPPTTDLQRVITPTGDQETDQFIESVVDRKRQVPDLEQIQEQQKPELLNRIQQGLGDIGTGFIAGLRAAPYRTLKGAKQWMDYSSKKHALQNPTEVAALLKELNKNKTPEQIEADIEKNKRVFKNVGEFTRDLEMDVPIQQQQRFMAKLGRGFASLPQSFIPGAIALQVWGDSFDQAKSQGKTDDDAASFATTQALLQEATERIGAGLLGRIFKSGGSLLWKAVKGFGTESTQELSQEGIAAIAEKVYGVTADSPLFQRLLEAWGIGGLTGAGGTAVVGAIPSARRSVAQKIDEEMLDAVAEGDERKVLKLEKERQKIIDEEIKETTKEGEEIAQRAREEVAPPSPEQAVEPGEEKRIRIRDDAEVGVEAEPGVEAVEEEAIEAPPEEIEGLPVEAFEAPAVSAEIALAEEVTFKTTEEAQEFAKTATKEDIDKLQKTENRLREEVKTLLKEDKVQEAVNVASQAQFAREAREEFNRIAPKVTPKAPEVKVKPSEAVKKEPLPTIKEKAISTPIKDISKKQKWEIGAKREFKFDPNSTKKEGRFRFKPAPEVAPDYFDKGAYTVNGKKKDFIKRNEFAGVKLPEGIDAVVGKVKGKEEVQELVFDKDIWNEEEAADWLAKTAMTTNLDFFSPKVVGGIEEGVPEPEKEEPPKPEKPSVKKVSEADIRKKIRESFKEKTESQLNIKKSIIEYAKENISLKDRGKLLATVKNAKTQLDLQKAIEMMDRFAEKTKASALRAQIKKELKTTKIKKVAGKPKGKFTADIQESLDILRAATKRSKAAAQERLEANLSLEDPSPAIARENAILNMVANSDTMTSGELQEALDDIKSLKETGRLISELKRESFKVEMDDKKDRIVNVIEGTVGQKKKDPDLEPEPVTRVDGEKILRNRLKTLSKSMVGWNDVLDMLSFNDKTSKPFESDLSKIAKVSDQETAEKKGNRITLEKVNDLARKAYGIKTDKALVKKFNKDSEVYLKIGKLELTKAQARKKWMEFQDTNLDDTFENMGFTDAVKQRISDSLTKEDKAFAQAQLDFYKDYYKETNDVYKELNGVNLPQTENYSPIAREDFGKEPDLGDLLNEVRHRNSIAPGSLKARTANKLPLAQLSDVETLMKHINDMEHYKAWAFKIRELSSIFNDPTIKEAITRQYGRNSLKIVNSFMEDFKRGRVDTSKNFNWIDRLRVNFTTSVLGAKPALAIKQLASIPAYAENMPTKDFVVGLADFFRHPIRNTRILSESELLKARGENLTRDMRDAMKTKEYAIFRKKPGFKNALMVFTKMGDRGAILAGGWAVYRHARKQGKTHQQALTEFEERTSQAQQSADLSQLSEWQRGSSFTKLFTMFTTSQNQYFRRELAAIRNLFAERASKAQVAKTIAIYHFVLPMLFQFISNGFKWADKDQLRAAVIGPLNGVFILKDALDAIVRTIQKEKTFGFGLPLWDSVEEFNKSLRKIDWDDISMEDVIEATKKLATAGGLVTGFGVKELINKYEGAKDFMDDDKKKGIMRMLGWSKWAIEQGEKSDNRRKRKR